VQINEFNKSVSLGVLDSPDVEQTQFGPDMKRWLSIIVDIINDNFTTLSNLITAQGIDIGGMGAGPITVTVIGLTSDGFVNVNLISATNPNIHIIDVTPGLNSFTVTFDADPGASAIIVYQAYSQSPPA
jgi:hypothetical protein